MSEPVGGPIRQAAGCSPGQPPRLDHSPLHHREEPRAIFEQGDVGQDVAVDDQEIGELARLDGAELLAPGP